MAQINKWLEHTETIKTEDNLAKKIHDKSKRLTIKYQSFNSLNSAEIRHFRKYISLKKLFILYVAYIWYSSNINS